MNILVINGPNLNFLGIRETNIYGTQTYQDLEDFLHQLAKDNQVNLETYQTNHEGSIIDKIQSGFYQQIDAIIINPGAYTHYSYAIKDAIKAVNMKVVEVHLSDLTKREDFRKISVISDVCVKTFMGNGFDSYKDALMYLVGE